MSFKLFRVFFARTAFGQKAGAIAPRLARAVQDHGSNLPVLDLSGDKHQMRDLQQTGTVWKGIRPLATRRQRVPSAVRLRR